MAWALATGLAHKVIEVLAPPIEADIVEEAKDDEPGFTCADRDEEGFTLRHRIRVQAAGHARAPFGHDVVLVVSRADRANGVQMGGGDCVHVCRGGPTDFN